jgi:hypothetical protein
LAWPTKPPKKGYDWACNGAIPSVTDLDATQLNNIEEVKLTIDTTRVDWSWIWDSVTTSADPGNFITGFQQQGKWLVYPSPAAIGSSLYLRSFTSSPAENHRNLKIVFLDLQGRIIFNTDAVNIGNGQWMLSSINVPVSGLYLMKIYNRGGNCANLKILVK